MYDLHRLRLLRELSLRGTLAAVADALGYSASAVSHQLSTLEREVGVPLLEPAGRGVRLTHAAQRLVRHTERILAELERAEASVAASRSEVSGTARIATFQTAAHALLPGVIRRLSADHPGLSVSFSHVAAHAAIPGLLARDFDVVLSERYPGEPGEALAGVLTKALLSDPLYLAIPAAWDVDSIEGLENKPWVFEHEGASVRRFTDALCRAAGFAPKVTFQSGDVYLHTELVSQGLAAAVVPGLSVRPRPDVAYSSLGVARTIELSTRAGSETSPVILAVTSALHAASQQ